MEDKQVNSDCVTFVMEEKSVIPSKQNTTITKEIFDSAAKFRTKHMLDKALQMQKNHTSKEIFDNGSIIDLNDTGDFKEAPKFKKKLRLKVKNSSSSSSSTIFSDVIVIDNKNSSQSLPEPLENKHILSVECKDKIINERFTHLQEVSAACSKENTNPENGGVEENSINSSSKLFSNQGKSYLQACLVCGVDIDVTIDKTHRLNCLRHNFSKLDTERAQDDERIVQIKCHMCNKNITHMNSHLRAQHINMCIDKDYVAKQEEITYQQKLLAARTAVLNCPMCGKKFRVQPSRQSHLKKCAVANKMTVDQVKNLIKQQEEEHQTKLNAGILPEDFMPSKSKSLQIKDSKSTRSKSKLDEDMQLALALSTSLVENRKEKEDFVHFDGTSKESQVVAGRVHGRNKKGKLTPSTSLLMTLSREEAMERISNRISRYIFSATRSCSFPYTRLSKMGSTATSSSSSSPPTLWSKASLDISALRSSQTLVEKTDNLSFYVKELMPPLSVNTVSAGSKLKRVSIIPGRRMSGERDQHIETEGNIDNNNITSPPPSQTVEILTRLALESDQGMVDEIACRDSDVKIEYMSDVTDETCDLQPSGFCKESPVKTESNTSDIAASYLSLVNCPKFSDLIISADNRSEIHAHKIILHARCPELLAMSLMKDGRDIIDLSSYGKETILCVLNYIYGGQTSLYSSCHADVEQLADRFSLAGLKAAVCCAVENLDVNDITTARIECDIERDIDEDNSQVDERNERDDFNDSDLLDIFQTQRDNLKHRTKSNKCVNMEVMEQGETGNCNQENENVAKNEKDVTDIHENNLNEIDATMIHSDEISKTLEHAHQTNNMDCGKHWETYNNKDLNVMNRNEENHKKTLFPSSEEIEMTFPIRPQVPKYNLGKAYTNIIGKNHSTESLPEIITKERKTNTTTVGTDLKVVELSILESPLLMDDGLYPDEAKKTVKPNTPERSLLSKIITNEMTRNKTTFDADLNLEEENILENLLLMDHSPQEADETKKPVELNTSDSSMFDNSLPADLSWESVELNTSKSTTLVGFGEAVETRELIRRDTSDNTSLIEYSHHTDLAGEPMKLSTSENSLLMGHTLPTDIITKESTAQKNDTTVNSQVRKRKRNKVSKKEFKTLIHKALSSLSDTSTDSFQKLQEGLTDEDVKRIQIKIEQGLQVIDDPNDSVYIPNVLEDTGENQNEVIITHADIKVPLKKPRRRQGKKSNSKSPMKHSLFPELLVPANQSLCADNSLTNNEHITLKTSVLEESIIVPVELTTADSGPVTPQKSALLKKCNLAKITENTSPPTVSLTSASATSSLVTPHTFLLQENSSKAVQSSHFATKTSLHVKVCDSAPKQLSPSTNIQCSGVLPVASSLKKSAKSSAIGSLGIAAQSSESSDIFMNRSLQPEHTSFSNSRKSSVGDKSSLSSPNSSKLSDYSSQELCKDKFINCSAQDAPYRSSNLVHRSPTFLSTKSTDAEYISGEELFSDDEEYLRPLDSKLMPLKSHSLSDYEKDREPRPSNSKVLTTNLLSSLVVDEKESRPSNSTTIPVKLLSPLTDNEKESRPSNIKVSPAKLCSPSVKIQSKPSNSKTLSAELHSPLIDEKESRPLNSETKSSKLPSPSDPSWMLTTHLMSYSPALEQIANKTITQNEKSVRRNIFSPDSSGTPPSILHSVSSSGSTLKQTHQRVCMKSDNSAAESPYPAYSVISSPDTPCSKADKNVTMECKLRDNFTAKSTTINTSQSFNTFVTLSKMSDDIKNTHYIKATSTQTPDDTVVTSVLKSQVKLKPALQPQLKIHLSNIKSPSKKISEPFEHAEQKSNSVKTVQMQKNITSPHCCDSSDGLISSVPRTLLTVENKTPNKHSDTSEKSQKDMKLCQVFTSLHSKSPPKNSGVSDHTQSTKEVSLGKLITASSPKEAHFTSSSTQFQEKKTSLTREPMNEAELFDAGYLLPLRQRLGLSSPFQRVSGQLVGSSSKSKSELNKLSESSGSTNAQIIVQSVANNKTLEKPNKGILYHDFMSMDDSVVDDNLLEDLPVEPKRFRKPHFNKHTYIQICNIKTPQHQNTRKVKSKKRVWKEPSPFTPMAPYDEMTTPELKKAVSKIGVRPFGKKRMRELLKHVYQETHKYETDSDYDGTPVKHKRDSSHSLELSTRAKLSHLPISISGTTCTANKPKPATKKTDSNKSKPATKRANVKKLASTAEKRANVITSVCELPGSQCRSQPQSQAKKTHDKRFTESSSDCVSVLGDIGDSHEEISGSQDSSYSDEADLPEESILQGWPEDDVAPSQLMQTSSQAVKDKLVQFVHHNKDVYESILMYEPLELDVLKKKLSEAAIKVNLSQVMDFLDERCITFTMKNMSSRNNRHRKKVCSSHLGKSPKKGKSLSQRTVTGSQQKNHK